ncbi:MAG: TonB-dependent receptor [Gemmatimonadota bacterium]|nr:TonB-dependent receptor [Gemmatimonadota bacterium]
MRGLSRLATVVLALGSMPIASALAAQTVTVVVRAESELGPIEGVRIRASGLAALTDTRGVALLQLGLGEHLIQADRIGFGPAELPLVLAALRDTTVTIALAPVAVESEGIVVTSGRTERRIEDVPIRIEAVTREEVEEKLLMTPGDIAMLLNETAGLRVQPTAPALGGASVRIQGLRGRYTQILTDGMPLYGGQAGALGPLQVPPMDLARVEVIKGAASALYGPTALGGVVNLISRRPEPARELLVNLSTLGGTDVVGWFADDLGERWGYTLLAGGHVQSFDDVNSDEWADVPEFRRFSARPRVFWNDGTGGSAMLTVGGMLEERVGGTVPGGLTPAGTEHTESLDTGRVDVGFIGQKAFAGGQVLSARASGSLQRHDHLYGEALEDDRHRTGFGEVALSGQGGRHIWVVGAAIQHDSYTHYELPQFSFDYTVPALFAQDEVEVATWLSLAGSLRYDHHNEFGGFFSPRISALARAAEWVARISGGTGFFAPTPFTEEVEAVGLSKLTPPVGWIEERARSAMVDLGRTFGPVEMNVSAFASTIDDPIQTVRNDDGTLTIRNATDGSVHTWGAELFTALREGPWRFFGSYAFLRSTEPYPQGTERREVPLTPRHSVGIVGAFEEEGRGRIGVEAYYTGLQEVDDDPYRTTSEPHFILGILVDRRFGRFRVFLNAENILDTRQTRYDPLLRPSQTPDGRWITDVWAPLEGRSFNGGVWISF